MSFKDFSRLVENRTPFSEIRTLKDKSCNYHSIGEYLVKLLPDFLKDLNDMGRGAIVLTGARDNSCLFDILYFDLSICRYFKEKEYIQLKYGQDVYFDKDDNLVFDQEDRLPKDKKFYFFVNTPLPITKQKLFRGLYKLRRNPVENVICFVNDHTSYLGYKQTEYITDSQEELFDQIWSELIKEEKGLEDTTLFSSVKGYALEQLFIRQLAMGIDIDMIKDSHKLKPKPKNFYELPPNSVEGKIYYKKSLKETQLKVMRRRLIKSLETVINHEVLDKKQQ